MNSKKIKSKDHSLTDISIAIVFFLIVAVLICFALMMQEESKINERYSIHPLDFRYPANNKP